MNNLLDLVKRWADKLTYRILKISGTSDAGLKNYLKGVQEQNEETIEADKELRGRVPLARYALWVGLVLLGAFAFKWISARRTH